jgi:hypothetical protein
MSQAIASPSLPRFATCVSAAFSAGALDKLDIKLQL